MLEVPGYRIAGEAGRGGWSVVYRAVDEASGEVVALKTIAPELAGQAWYRERFRRECAIATAVDHPNLVSVYATGEGWMAMQWVDATSLRELAPLSPPRATAIVAQVAAALDLLHVRGYVHRDVKPANVLVGRGDHAYLTDLGLAKEISPDPELTPEGRWLGTVDYAAPEQIRGQPTDGRADAYSLACVLGYAVTGSAPYPRATPEATMQAHLHEPPPRLPPALAALDPVMARGLAKDPWQRFSSAGELARVAAAAVAPPTPPKTRALVTAIAVVLATLALVGVVLAVSGDGGGGEDGDPAAAVPPPPVAPPIPSDELSVELLPEGRYDDSGWAYLNQDGDTHSLTVEIEIDDPPRGRIYEVWLYNSPTDAVTLGTAAPDSEGLLLTTRNLPRVFTTYAYVDLSLEPESPDDLHSGRSVARGALHELTGAPVP